VLFHLQEGPERAVIRPPHQPFDIAVRGHRNFHDDIADDVAGNQADGDDVISVVASVVGPGAFGI
jgi:hypothetical protein